MATVKLTTFCRIYRIVWSPNGDRCDVTSQITGAPVERFANGAWGDSGRLPEDIRDAAMDARPPRTTW